MAIVTSMPVDVLVAASDVALSELTTGRYFSTFPAATRKARQPWVSRSHTSAERVSAGSADTRSPIGPATS